MGLKSGCAFIMALAAAAQCQARPAANFGFGQAPTHEQLQELVGDHLRISLKDPNSVIDLSISKPVAACFSRGIFGRRDVCGWRMCVSYNAKNGYGGYVGLKSFVYWQLNGFGLHVVDNAGACPFEAEHWDGKTPPIYAEFCDVQPEHPDCSKGRREEFLEFTPVAERQPEVQQQSDCSADMRQAMVDKGLSQHDIAGICERQ